MSVNQDAIQAAARKTIIWASALLTADTRSKGQVKTAADRQDRGI
jgi:hypothetical protein